MDALRSVRADVCVLGICSLHPEVGVTTLDHEEAFVERAMVACAGEVIALAAADKLGTASPWVVPPLTDVDDLVTDADAELTPRSPRPGSTWCSRDAARSRHSSSSAVNGAMIGSWVAHIPWLQDHLDVSKGDDRAVPAVHGRGRAGGDAADGAVARPPSSAAS